jgi:hypothetical protein
MSIQKKITIDTIKQLVDINGESTNFKADFTVTAPNGDEFQLVVIDQNTLDGEAELKYQNVKGSLSGSITADKNLHQNYYLVLKADHPIPVEIKIDFEELPLTELEYNKEKIAPTPKASNNIISKTDGINWKLILIISVLVIGGYFLYKFYLQNNVKTPIAEDNSVKSPIKSPIKSPNIESPIKSPNIESKNSMKPPGGFTFGRVPAASKYY